MSSAIECVFREFKDQCLIENNKHKTTMIHHFCLFLVKKKRLFTFQSND